MNFTDQELRLIGAVLDADSESFVYLAHLAGLRPECDFRGANLRGVDFRTDDLSGFDFRGADLTGANLSRARGLHRLKIDATTRFPNSWHPPMPPGFSLTEIHLRILSGQQVPKRWRPFVGSLDFHQAKLEDLTPLIGLTKLQNLNLGGTLVGNLQPLARLSKLRELNLSFSRVIDLSPLSRLINLQVLDLESTRVSDLHPLAGLTNLEILKLTNSWVRDVTPLADLVHLRILDIGNTLVEDVAPLARLIRLYQLSLYPTRVRTVRPLAHIRNAVVGFGVWGDDKWMA